MYVIKFRVGEYLKVQDNGQHTRVFDIGAATQFPTEVEARRYAATTINVVVSYTIEKVEG